VAHEGERNTLDFLLLLPIERWQILFVKWVGAVDSPIAFWLLAMLALPLIGMISTMFPPRAALLLLVLPWPSLAAAQRARTISVGDLPAHGGRPTSS